VESQSGILLQQQEYNKRKKGRKGGKPPILFLLFPSLSFLLFTD